MLSPALGPCSVFKRVFKTLFPAHRTSAASGMQSTRTVLYIIKSFDDTIFCPQDECHKWDAEHPDRCADGGHEEHEEHEEGEHEEGEYNLGWVMLLFGLGVLMLQPFLYCNLHVKCI